MKKDLIILVADKNIEFALKGIFHRPQSLSIRPIKPDIYVHPHRDAGCFNKGDIFLRPFMNSYTHALIVFDHDGCGQEQLTREQLEHDLETRLSKSGWEKRAVVIVLDPELEIWVWNDSPHVATILGWHERLDLKTWLANEQFLREGKLKPNRPKEALEKVLRIANKPRSSILYEELAKKVSFARCTDKAFIKLKTTLIHWFATTSSPN